MQETTNLKLPLYELDDAANLVDGYNAAMGLIDTAYKANEDRFPITSSDIEDGGINTVDIANGAVTTIKIADNSITAAKLDDEISNSIKSNETIVKEHAHYFTDLSITDEQSAITLHNKINSAFNTSSVNSTKIENIENNITYKTPEQFGAVGDGITDDADAFQNAIDSFSQNGGLLVISNTYYISKTINIPSNINITGQCNNSLFPTIYFRPGIGILFNVNGTNHTFENFSVWAKSDSISDTDVAIRLNSDSNYNCDCKISGITIVYANSGIYITGRNVSVNSCLLSHCRYGVYFNAPSGATQIRGIDIRDTRFHGIGEEIVNGNEIYAESAGVYVANNYNTNLTIQNCISDQGAALFKGFVSSALISNNFVETFVTPAIEIISTESTGKDYGNTKIIGNTFYGKNGKDYWGYTHDYPQTLLSVNTYSNVTIESNNFARSKTSAIDLTNVATCSVKNNYFNKVGGTAISANAVKNESSIIGNIYIGRDPYPTITDYDEDALIFTKDNINFGTKRTFGNLIVPQNQYLVSQGQFGTTSINTGHQNVFYLVSRNSEEFVCFLCRRISGNVYSLPCYTTSKIHYLTWNNASIPTHHIMDFNGANNTTVSDNYYLYSGV